jgi:hypothetical protein
LDDLPMEWKRNVDDKIQWGPKKRKHESPCFIEPNGRVRKRRTNQSRLQP